MKSFIANTIVKWFKSCGIFGRQRFWILYWAYQITGWHIRHQEWDFVLEYLPPLMKGQRVRVLDVGCSRNLFAYEVVARGYELVGIDLEKPNFKYPGDIFDIWDIRKSVPVEESYNFITCISVLEHVGDGKWQDQIDAVGNMIKGLVVGGRLLLTIPTHEFAQGHPWHGFTYTQLVAIRPSNSEIIEYTEKAGQICCVIERMQ